MYFYFAKMQYRQEYLYLVHDWVRIFFIHEYSLICTKLFCPRINAKLTLMFLSANWREIDANDFFLLVSRGSARIFYELVSNVSRM